VPSGGKPKEIFKYLGSLRKEYWKELLTKKPLRNLSCKTKKPLSFSSDDL
jgi:hypothetical protein